MPGRRNDPLNLFNTPPPRFGFSWSNLFADIVKYIAIPTLILTLIGGIIIFIWHVEEKLGDIKSKQGRIEAQVEVLMQERKENSMKTSQERFNNSVD